MAKEGRKKFSWKEFFRPNGLKILLTIVFFLSLPLLIFVLKGKEVNPFPSIYLERYTLVIVCLFWLFVMGIMSSGSINKAYESLVVFFRAYPFTLIFSVFLAYIFACIIQMIYKKIINRKRKILFILIILLFWIACNIYFGYLPRFMPKIVNVLQ